MMSTFELTCHRAICFKLVLTGGLAASTSVKYAASYFFLKKKVKKRNSVCQSVLHKVKIIIHQVQGQLS